MIDLLGAEIALSKPDSIKFNNADEPGRSAQSLIGKRASDRELAGKTHHATTPDCPSARICRIYAGPSNLYAAAMQDDFLFIFQKGIRAAIE